MEAAADGRGGGGDELEEEEEVDIEEELEEETEEEGEGEKEEVEVGAGGGGGGGRNEGKQHGAGPNTKGEVAAAAAAAAAAANEGHRVGDEGEVTCPQEQGQDVAPCGQLEEVFAAELTGVVRSGVVWGVDTAPTAKVADVVVVVSVLKPHAFIGLAGVPILILSSLVANLLSV